MSFAIEINALGFSYPGAQRSFEISDLKMTAGESVFLYGPSGSGKTTLLSLITGILLPHTGDVRLLGESFSRMGSSQRDRFRADHVGYIFQQFNLIPYLSALENIRLPVELSTVRRQRLRHSLEDEAKMLAARLGISDSLHLSPLKLSVGQQQRVAVARALLGRPEIIIADEPTSALDEDRQSEFVQLLVDQSRDSGATVVFVSHNRSLERHFSRSASLSELGGFSK